MTTTNSHAEIRELANELREATSGTRALAISAVNIGHRLGTAIETARGELSQMLFTSLLAGAGLTMPHAVKLMALAKTYTLEDLRGPNAQRQGMLAIGCLPEKSQVHHADDGAVVVSVGLGTCVGHFNKFLHAVASGRATLDTAQAKAQTRTMHLWLCKLHGTPVESF